MELNVISFLLATPGKSQPLIPLPYTASYLPTLLRVPPPSLHHLNTSLSPSSRTQFTTIPSLLRERHTSIEPLFSTLRSWQRKFPHLPKPSRYSCVSLCIVSDFHADLRYLRNSLISSSLNSWPTNSLQQCAGLRLKMSSFTPK